MEVLISEREIIVLQSSPAPCLLLETTGFKEPIKMVEGLQKVFVIIQINFSLSGEVSAV